VLKKIFGFFKSDFVKKVIVIGIDTLIESKTAGIDKQLAKTLLEKIVESKDNQVTKMNVINALDKVK
jgi:hypothetical protein